MKKFAILAVLAALSAAASATQPIFGGDTTNNYDQRTYNTPSAVGNGYGGAGGQGGAGGAGGRGGDGGNATVLGSGNSSNTNLNSNMQGQAQGQAQGQSLRNNIANTNTSGSSSGASASNGGNTTGSQSITVQGDRTVYQAQERNPVPTAYAAPLTSSNGTCMGSSSIGGQGAAVGLSFGTTWTDSGCDARYDATALANVGMQKAAIERLCLKAEIAQAMKAAGTPCESDRKAASAPKRAEAEAPAQQVTYQDPIIRSRLGLPPLSK